VTEITAWYARQGRHDLPWRRTRDRWAVLVSEVMLHQTQVPRVSAAWPEFYGRFPTHGAMADAGPGAVIQAWGTLGYPRRARRLWEAAVAIAAYGWPDDLTSLPGVGRYTARAVAAQCDDTDLPAVEVNGRRVAERTAGRALADRDAEAVLVELGAPLRGRDRLLALMDVGALVCRPRDPHCDACPLRRRARPRRPVGERIAPTPIRRLVPAAAGLVMARLRAGEAVEARSLDADALASLVYDGLAVVDRDARARLP
jgi:A/G-specific adenine glycosylase